MEEEYQPDNSSGQADRHTHSAIAARTSSRQREQLASLVQVNTGQKWAATKWGSRFTPGGAVKLSENGVIVAGRKVGRKLPFLKMIGVEVDKGLIWSSIKIEMEQTFASVTLKGLKHEDAVAAIAAIKHAFTLANVRALQSFLPRAKDVNTRVDGALAKAGWVPTSELQDMCQSVASQPERDAPDWPRHAAKAGALAYFSDNDVHALALMLDPLIEVSKRVAPHNEAFLEQELAAREAFFDTIEKNPLTDEQRIAAIVFDDNVLTIAAAGSGKTSTLVAKAGYAVQAGIAKPEEILLLAFNKDAAEELRERVRHYLSKSIQNATDITVSTFHAFGLSVIGVATGKRPRVAPWIDQGKDGQKLAQVISELKKQKIFAIKWALFRSAFLRPLPKLGDKEEPEWWDLGTKALGFRTIRGETVKSKEELMIADWLAINGIDYRYESRYEHETATSGYSQYHPDFFYPSAQLYHEHFALDQFGKAPSAFVDYEEGVAWKRQLHEKKETKLIETTSYGIRQVDGFQKLEAQLKEYGVVFGEIPLTQQQEEALGDEADLINLIRTFLIHVKSNHLGMADLRQRAKYKRLGDRSHPARESLFLDLFEQIWARWDGLLSEEDYVDFEDMLSKAADHLIDGSFRSPYKLVMADEFQDTSIVRGRMLQSLTKEPRTRLFVVGDDWQAINRFAGADISLMSNFGDYFGFNTILKLTKTFRCPRQISDVAASFVSKNPTQIKKDVTSVSPRTGQSIRCYAIGGKHDASGLLGSHLQQLYQKLNPSDSSRKSAIVMGRYWHDQPPLLAKWQVDLQDKLDIRYSTVHGSKGLEADYVFLVNLTKGRMGFPSEIEDDPLLQLAMPVGEAYEHAEERRLFYVALTRAKEMIILYTHVDRVSPFLIELKKDRAIKIQSEDGQQEVEECPDCSQGSLIVRRSRYGQFLSCSRFPRCSYKRSLTK